MMLRMSSEEPEIGRRAISYLEKSIGKSMVTVEPFLVGLQAEAQLNISLPDDFRDRFVAQLETGYLPNGLYGLAQGFLALSRFESRNVSNEDLERFYLAVLKNPRLGGVGRGHMLTSYSIFLAEQQQDYQKAAEVAEEAVMAAPKFIPFMQNAALMAYAAQKEARAFELLREIQRMDRLGLHRRETERVENFLGKTPGA
jgi:hypothetical protein